MSNSPPRDPHSRDSDRKSGPGRFPLPAWGVVLIGVASLAAGWWTDQFGLGDAPAPQPAVVPVITSQSGTVVTHDGSLQSPTPQVGTSDPEPRITSRQRAADTPTEIAITPARTAPAPSQQTGTGTSSPKTGSSTVIRGVTLKNVDGEVVYRGDIDLQPTIDRIANGSRNSHRNDGSFFSNREGRLPRKSSGYYREYVVPTPDLRGPGPQRLVRGQQGELYYTSDHYKTFRKIDARRSTPVKSGSS